MLSGLPSSSSGRQPTQQSFSVPMMESAIIFTSGKAVFEVESWIFVEVVQTESPSAWTKGMVFVLAWLEGHIDQPTVEDWGTKLDQLLQNTEKNIKRVISKAVYVEWDTLWNFSDWRPNKIMESSNNSE